MARFQFRLQVVLDQKMETKKQAEEDLAKRQAELASEETVLTRLQRQEEGLAQRLRNARRELADRSAASSSDLLSSAAHIDLLGQDLDSARDDVFAQELVLEEFKEKVEQAKTHVMNCSREVEALTKYRDKLEKRYLRQIEQKEELELDEIGNMLYTSRRVER